MAVRFHINSTAIVHISQTICSPESVSMVVQLCSMKKLLSEGDLLIKVPTGSILRFLPRAVQLLELLPKADTTSHF